MLVVQISLISWVYNLTFEFNNFNMGAVVSLIIGFIVAIVAFIQFRRTSTFKDEGGFYDRKEEKHIKSNRYYSFIAMMFVIILYPLLWTFGISLNPGTNLYGAKIIQTMQHLKIMHLYYSMTVVNTLTWYKNTLIVASANALFSVIFVTLTAYAFSRYRFVGS